MFKRKAFLRAVLVATVWWCFVFIIAFARNIEFLNLFTWVGIPLSIVASIFVFRLRLDHANLVKDQIDDRWFSRLNNPFVFENMAALDSIEPLEPLGKANFLLIDSMMPYELDYNVITACRSHLKGQYLRLFDEILGVLTHPDNQVPAYFPQEGDSSKTKRNHDGRSLLEHSLLVLACSLEISIRGKDPLQKESFLNQKIEFVPDEFLRDDPMIAICALAHDLGKITAYKSKSRSLAQHDQQGQKIIASLPAYQGDGQLSKEDYLILDNVLGFYHRPQSAIVGHRLDSAQRIHLVSLSNRFHRIMEIVIEGDMLAGSIEARAPLVRDKVGYVNLHALKLSENDWAEHILVADDFKANTQVEGRPLDPTLVSQEIIESIENFICSPLSVINPTKEQFDLGLGFVQSDLELGINVLFVRADMVLNHLEKEFGKIFGADPLENLTRLLSENNFISHPLDAKINSYQSTWVWNLTLYLSEKVIHVDKDGYRKLIAGTFTDENLFKSKVGPFYLIDLSSNYNDAFDKRFKGFGKIYCDYYALISGDCASQISIWRTHSKSFLEKRAKELQMIHVDGVVKSDNDFVLKPSQKQKVKQEKALLRVKAKDDIKEGGENSGLATKKALDSDGDNSINAQPPATETELSKSFIDSFFGADFLEDK